jgi:class 3 adenylate cyclase
MAGDMSETRRLAAILTADVAGYSRLMGVDEVGTAQALREHRTTADPLIAEHGGRVVKTTGDGLLIEFGSVVGAVECAVGLQRLAAERNAGTPAERRMEWRIGVHLGDVLIEGDDILGDGVNIAARLEGIAEPGGICISDDAFRQVRGKVEAEFADLGEQSLKNIARPLRVYRVGRSPTASQPISAAAALPLPDKPSIAVLPFANMSGDPEQEYFADGMVEEVITALSRIRWLFVSRAEPLSSNPLAGDPHHHLVQMPSVARPRATPTQPSRDRGTEFQHPAVGITGRRRLPAGEEAELRAQVANALRRRRGPRIRKSKSDLQSTPWRRKTDSNWRSLRERKGYGELLDASIALSGPNL